MRRSAALRSIISRNAAPRSGEGFLWRASTICYHVHGDPTATWEVSMNFLQNRWIMWGGAVVIVLIVLAVVYGLPGGETPPAQ